MFLTKQGGIIVKPISVILGKLMSLIYDVSSNMGIVSIGLSIIVFTLVIRLMLIPLMIKQNKSSKLMAYIQPEINKVTKKYKGKKDQDSLMAQQRETRAIQEKYGVSMTGGCLTSLIQMPIFFALYRVIQNIPAYVDKVRNLYEPMANDILSDEKAYAALKEFKETYKVTKSVKLEEGNLNSIIDVLAKFPSEAWDKYCALVSDNSNLVGHIADNKDKIHDTYTFVGGIDLTTAPGFALTAAFLIPVLSCLFQFMSMKVTPQQATSNDPAQQQTMKTMRTMMYIFPLMSFFVTVNMPAGVGVYWATGALISFFTSLFINLYFKKCDMEKLLEKSKVKAEKKRAKREAKGKKSFAERMQEAAYGQQTQANVNNKAANSSLKSYNTKSINSANNAGVQYRAGSLASKANAMQRLNSKNDGGKN